MNSRKGFTKAPQRMMYLRKETSDGLRSMYAIVILTTHFQLYVYLFTANSFVELIRYLFKVPGVKIFFSRTLCQDPLENIFECQRQRGVLMTILLSKNFSKTQALCIVNSFCRPVVKGNCRGNMTMKEIHKKAKNLSILHVTTVNY